MMALPDQMEIQMDVRPWSIAASLISNRVTRCSPRTLLQGFLTALTQ
jgi:hypothetical protein